MARTNKYASINFNDIYEKKNINPATKKPSSAPSAISSTRTHGGMLVLTRPSPTPQPQPQPQPKSQAPTPTPTPNPTPTPPKPADPIQTPLESDPISLRPLGRTGTGSSPSPSPFSVSSVKEPATVLQPAKPDPFVPPHLRPGFVGREERVAQEGQRQQGFRHREYHGHNHGSPGRYTEDGRPKSGGHERMRRGGGGGGDSDLPVDMNRPSSSGNGSSSGGWYGPYGQRSPANANHYFHHQQF
ncbi:translation initiation factor IF-2 [Macadamia integrifolia]|uniref:translation initiation factor IF-2 n=1 Tax=Macadamia integrifolia TaxID=60698 RepID=UPI001C4FE0D9|nr:translation initiation factor IF-2 [Macadamia integrifolia]